MLDILAAAAEHGEHAEATAWGLNAGGWVAVAMIVVFVLAILAGAPRIVAGILDSRIEGIRKQLDEARSLRAEAEKLRDEYARKAAEADKEAAALRAQAADPGSELRRALARAIQSAGERLLSEPALAAIVQMGTERAVRYVVEHFGGEITNLVSSTIARWDGEETAQRLELLLGPDLQFIRINGTVVGGAAGLCLHALAQLLG